MKCQTGNKTRRPRPFVVTVAPALTMMCAVGLLLPLLTRVIGEVSPTVAWALDLAAHWQLVFVTGLIISVSLAVFSKPHWGLLQFLISLPWITAWPTAPNLEGDGTKLVVITTNVSVGNSDPAPLVDWIRSKEPDVLAIVEISDEFAQKLELNDSFPYQVVRPRSDPFGLALLSRHPIVAHQSVNDAHGVQRIEAKLNWRGNVVTVIAFHPMPPLTPADHIRRNEDLSILATRLKDVPTVILGDFNATPWSSAFAAPTRAGFRLASGYAPTWPAAGGGIMGLPIDNVLVSRHWTATRRKVGPDVGSDHLPVLTVIAFDMPGRPMWQESMPNEH